MDYGRFYTTYNGKEWIFLVSKDKLVVFY